MMEWRDVTPWSVETTDGKFYAERDYGGPRWQVYENAPTGRRWIGSFDNEDDAKAWVEFRADE